MEDIGMPPDFRSMSPDQKNYDETIGEGFRCPWCEEDINVGADVDLDTLFLWCIQMETWEKECETCGAKMKIEFQFIPLAEPYAAKIGAEVTATIRLR